MGDSKERFSPEALIKRYNLDIVALEKEQKELAAQIVIKDGVDFSRAARFGAVSTTFIQNKILTCILVCDAEYEVVDSAYVYTRVAFPYLPGFRSYRELPAMIEAFEKLQERPDVFFIPAQGISHAKLGLASHFGLSTGVPTIGVASALVDAHMKGEDIIRAGKKVGKVLQSKEKSNPLYISPGHAISIETAYTLCKQAIVPPHKRPEPIHLAAKYAKRVKKELVNEG